jgi:hypothetical protein
MLEDRQGAEKRIAEAEPLETHAGERERMLAYWASEERVTIVIQPDEDDKKAALAHKTREFPPMVFKVNGVEIAVPKGRMTKVPQSIADLWMYMLDPWSARSVAKPHTFEDAEARLV